MTSRIKQYETIGCCGIDCGLCPRFYTKGSSACPGCGGVDFREKHPSCGMLTCCAVKKGLEVCSQCSDYPCKRFESDNITDDSFVTHKRMLLNLDYIKINGIESFINEQKPRIDILNDLLAHFDDGRSKSFYCISCALLPIAKLRETQAFAHSLSRDIELKEKCKVIKCSLNSAADSLKIELKLKKNE